MFMSGFVVSNCPGPAQVCREIAASSVTDLWMAMEFDQVSNKWTDFIRRLSQNYYIYPCLNILSS